MTITAGSSIASGRGSGVRTGFGAPAAQWMRARLFRFLDIEGTLLSITVHSDGRALCAVGVARGARWHHTLSGIRVIPNRFGEHRAD
ncbi:hypothetical protein GCM10018790_70100 [Kitasatospora xanthocidica]|nr:hypothetical protein GCM10018790_70100 [Kitasatospora xanthocidica]